MNRGMKPDTDSHMPFALLGEEGWRSMDPFLPIEVCQAVYVWNFCHCYGSIQFFRIHLGRSAFNLIWNKALFLPLKNEICIWNDEAKEVRPCTVFSVASFQLSYNLKCILLRRCLHLVKLSWTVPLTTAWKEASCDKLYICIFKAE